jgi:flagellar FliJ protein
MIADLNGTARGLEGAIKAEQDRTGIHDPAHFAYSTCAKAMTQRRDNLIRSIDKLKRQLADAKLALE